MVGVIVLAGVAGRALSGGSYEFIAMQGDHPVTWNHCQAIRYHVNPKGAPEGWEQVVEEAVDDIEAASGFVFMDLGTTSKTHLIGQRYDGNDWEPVLILWTDRYQDSMMERAIGTGGSGSVLVDGMQRFVVGKVSLNSSVRDPEQTKLTLEHELGHVLGLDHVDDPDQLMHHTASGQDGLGRGDVNGLRELHDVPCTTGQG